MPKADPSLLRDIGRIGANLNQIARWLNITSAEGQSAQVNLLMVSTRLVAIERALSCISAMSQQTAFNMQDKPSC